MFFLDWHGLREDKPDNFLLYSVSAIVHGLANCCAASWLLDNRAQKEERGKVGSELTSEGRADNVRDEPAGGVADREGGGEADLVEPKEEGRRIWWEARRGGGSGGERGGEADLVGSEEGRRIWWGARRGRDWIGCGKRGGDETGSGVGSEEGTRLDLVWGGRRGRDWIWCGKGDTIEHEGDSTRSLHILIFEIVPAFLKNDGRTECLGFRCVCMGSGDAVLLIAALSEYQDIEKRPEGLMRTEYFA